jgi:hypothetical protein
MVFPLSRAEEIAVFTETHGRERCDCIEILDFQTDDLLLIFVVSKEELDLEDVTQFTAD